MRRTISLWAPVFLYGGFIFYISSLSSSDLPPIGNYDKIIHAFEFLILGILLSRAFNPDLKVGILKFLVLVNTVNILYGASDEVHQLFIPGREFSWDDLLADIIGGALGSIGYLLFQTKKIFFRTNRIQD